MPPSNADAVLALAVPLQLGEKVRRGRIPGNSVEELRHAFGLESIKDPDGNVIREAPLPVSVNFQQRALDVAILEINTKTDPGTATAEAAPARNG